MPRKKRVTAYETETPGESVVFSDAANQLIDIVEESKDEAWKVTLQQIYDDRPIYIGREYTVLHRWYARIEALLH